MYQIDIVRGEDCNAFTKAPADAAKIARQVGFKMLRVRAYWWRYAILSSFVGTPLRFLQRVWFQYLLKRADVIFLQYPNQALKSVIGCDFIAQIRSHRQAHRQVKVITLIHDLDSLRFGAKENIQIAWKNILRVTDTFIVHNAAMEKLLCEMGLASEKLVNLQLFDYLSRQQPSQNQFTNWKSVAIAGNLGLEKAEYLKDLKTIEKVQWKLYGPHLDADQVLAQNVQYGGCIPADEIITRLSQGFGLVWDGTSIETCAGPTGEYLKINNPHKLSLYLAAGLPVIVWKQSAVADFVIQNKVGLAVDSLKDIAQMLDKMDENVYRELVANVQGLSNKLRSGYFLRAALERVLRL